MDFFHFLISASVQLHFTIYHQINIKLRSTIDVRKNITFKRETLILQGLLHTPNKAKFDLAILFYGFAGHMINSPCTLLPELAQELGQHNIASLRFDFSGHGSSDGNIEDMNILSQLEDAMRLFNMLKIFLGSTIST